MKPRATLILVLAAAAIAQTRPDIGPRMKENAEALRQYTWKRRIDIAVKGESKGARVDQVRFVDGKMESTPLETPPTRNKPFGLRGKIVEKKTEEMKQDIERLVALLQRYASPDPAVLERATISESGPDTVRMNAKGVVEPADSFTVSWNTATRRPQRIEIRTVLDGKPVTATMEFAGIPGGPFYAARTTLSFPKKDLDLTITNSEHVRVASR